MCCRDGVAAGRPDQYVNRSSPDVRDGLVKTLRRMNEASDEKDVSIDELIIQFDAFVAAADPADVQHRHMFENKQSKWTDTNGALWWATWGTEWPVLLWFALRILAQVSASSCSERCFSGAKYATGGGSRSNTDPATISKLVRVRQSLSQQLAAQVGVEVAQLTKFTSTVAALIASQRDALTAEADEEERAAAQELAAAMPPQQPLPAAPLPASVAVAIPVPEFQCVGCSAVHAEAHKFCPECGKKS